MIASLLFGYTTVMPAGKTNFYQMDKNFICEQRRLPFAWLSGYQCRP